MKKWLIIIILIALIGGSYGLYEYNRGPRDLSSEKADITMDASVLLTAFESDENAANTAYLDKVVKVSGTVLDLSAEGTPSVILDAGNPMSTVICELADSESNKELKIGDKVSIKGQCTGYLMDVVLVKSVIIKE